MTVTLSGEIQKIVDEHVARLRYPSAQAFVEAAVLEKLSSEQGPLSPETIAAIEEGQAQIDRGEFVTFEAFEKEIKAAYPGKI